MYPINRPLVISLSPQLRVLIVLVGCSLYLSTVSTASEQVLFADRLIVDRDGLSFALIERIDGPFLKTPRGPVRVRLGHMKPRAPRRKSTFASVKFELLDGEPVYIIRSRPWNGILQQSHVFGDFRLDVPPGRVLLSTVGFGAVFLCGDVVNCDVLRDRHAAIVVRSSDGKVVWEHSLSKVIPVVKVEPDGCDDGAGTDIHVQWLSASWLDDINGYVYVVVQAGGLTKNGRRLRESKLLLKAFRMSDGSPVKLDDIHVIQLILSERKDVRISVLE